MHFIKEIIQGDPEKEYIHRLFVRYSKGEFEGPFLKVKNTGKNLKIYASDAYASMLGKIITHQANTEFKVSGSIFSKENPEECLLENNIPIKKSSKKKGTYITEVDGEATGTPLAKVYDVLKESQLFLSLSPKQSKDKLKSKKKPTKPGSGTDEKFCLSTMSLTCLGPLCEELLFELEDTDFKEAELRHNYVIEEIIVPDEFKDDPLNARLNAKRKGQLIRTLKTDTETKEMKKEFII